jgi:hypothetical protein
MATTLEERFQQFLRERKYLSNLSPNTLEWYQTAWKYFRESATHSLTEPSQLN